MKSAIIIFVILTVGHFVKLALDAGVLTTIEQKPLECESIKNIHGPEDMALVDDKLFISSTYLPLRYQFEKGDIFLYDLKKPLKEPISLVKSFNLSPHGIFAKKFGDIIRLWAINHTKTFDSIEVFDFIDSELVHVQSIQSDLLINTNDIAAIDKERFYISHDHGSTNHYLKLFENFSRIGRGHISFFDGTKVSKVITGLSFANGIQIIDKKLYLAQMLNKEITIYNIQDDFSLSEKRSIPLPFLPDNISIKDKSNLTIAAHPKAFALKKHALDKRKIAPSAIMNLNIETGKASLIYMDKGDQISAASVGIIKNNKLYIGNIYSDFFLKCNL